jgi:ribosomal protein L11 methyltransferase
MPWLQLTFYSTKEKAEALAELLSDAGAAAVTMQDAADQPLYEPPPGATPLWQLTNVVGLFEENVDGHAIVQQLKAQWQGEFPDFRSEVLEDQDWERAWMDEFKPMRFGERLWIVPSWHEPPEGDTVNILLDPGLAFGTGTHPTTRLCLEWLDGHDVAGKSVIDYGCGSGILALAAALPAEGGAAGARRYPGGQHPGRPTHRAGAAPGRTGEAGGGDRPLRHPARAG